MHINIYCVMFLTIFGYRSDPLFRILITIGGNKGNFYIVLIYVGSSENKAISRFAKHKH